MKTTHAILSLLTVPALCCAAFAKETLDVVKLLPQDGFLPGRAIKPQFSEELAPILQKVEARFQKLSDEKKKEILEKQGQNRDRAFEYVPELWESKAEYENYIKVWKATKLIEVENVAIGIRKSSTADVWDIVSATIDKNRGKPLPLTLGALTYNSKKNVWESNNGTLEAKPFTEDELFIYGAQKGQSWTLNKEDALSQIVEAVRITETPDDKYIFIYYSFVELSKASGQVIAQGGYTLRFPIKKSSAAGVTRPGQR